MVMIKSIGRLRDCKRGNVLVLVAAVAPLLVGASAVGLDTIQLSLAKSRLQRSADSAAMAGAYAVTQNQSASTAADRDLILNNQIALSTPRVVENAPTTGTFAGDARAVRVVLTAVRSVPFISYFTGSSMTVSVEATAAAVPDGTYCIVSLENTAATGVTFAGSTDINLGCGVASNSIGTEAIRVNGNPDVRATPIAAVGGVPPASDFLGTTTVIPNNTPQPDPYANLANPVVPANCSGSLDVGRHDTVTLTGDQCFTGMDIKGTLILINGTITLNGGDMSFGSQAVVTGTNVTFVLTSSNATSNPSSIGEFDMNGGATINLTAPSTGPYANILIYQDRRAPLRNAHINGNSDSIIDGAIYMPSQELTFNGNTGMVVRCMRLIARQVRFSGNSSVVNTCPSGSPNRGYTGTTVRLVG